MTLKPVEDMTVEELREEVRRLRPLLPVVTSAELRRVRAMSPSERRVLRALYDAAPAHRSLREIEEVTRRGKPRHPHIVKVYVSMLRSALGKARIETVPRAGYRLTPEGVAWVDAVLEEARAAEAQRVTGRAA